MGFQLELQPAKIAATTTRSNNLQAPTSDGLFTVYLSQQKIHPHQRRRAHQTAQNLLVSHGEQERIKLMVQPVPQNRC